MLSTRPPDVELSNIVPDKDRGDRTEEVQTGTFHIFILPYREARNVLEVGRMGTLSRQPAPETPLCPFLPYSQPSLPFPTSPALVPTGRVHMRNQQSLGQEGCTIFQTAPQRKTMGLARALGVFPSFLKLSPSNQELPATAGLCSTGEHPAGLLEATFVGRMPQGNASIRAWAGLELERSLNHPTGHIISLPAGTASSTFLASPSARPGWCMILAKFFLLVPGFPFLTILDSKQAWEGKRGGLEQ